MVFGLPPQPKKGVHQRVSLRDELLLPPLPRRAKFTRSDDSRSPSPQKKARLTLNDDPGLPPPQTPPTGPVRFRLRDDLGPPFRPKRVISSFNDEPLQRKHSRRVKLSANDDLNPPPIPKKAQLRELTQNSNSSLYLTKSKKYQYPSNMSPTSDHSFSRKAKPHSYSTTAFVKEAQAVTAVSDSHLPESMTRSSRLVKFNNRDIDEAIDDTDDKRDLFIQFMISSKSPTVAPVAKKCGINVRTAQRWWQKHNSETKTQTPGYHVFRNRIPNMNDQIIVRPSETTTTGNAISKSSVSTAEILYRTKDD